MASCFHFCSYFFTFTENIERILVGLRLELGQDLFFCVSDGNAMAAKVLLLALVLTAMFAVTWISVWDVTPPINGLISKCRMLR